MTEARDNETKETGFASERIVGKSEPIAYLSLQVCLQIDHYVQVLVSALLSFFMVYKVYLYTYPLHWALGELGLLILLQCLQFLRLFVGSKGNKNENSSVMFYFTMLTILTTVVASYFLLLQTYVIIFEGVMIGITILFGIIELIMGFIALVEFYA